jgi:hypothetical protein
MIALCQRLASDALFHDVIIGVTVLNAGILGLETSAQAMQAAGGWLLALNHENGAARCARCPSRHTTGGHGRGPVSVRRLRDERPHLCLVEGFPFEQQQSRAAIENVPVAVEDGRGRREGFIDKASHCGVDRPRGLVAVGAVATGGRVSEEPRAVLLEGEVTEFRNHAVARDHAPRDIGRADQVV